ncbi:HAD-IB family phosphatase [Veronia pacifica]|uniref:Haloacid dehalogenase n=1 Tax=Veronia pacifica TaxID=1080227 RepID=A0A1C3E7L0_9GAMM|nr:HAD-IB family phosphatase [Veronia pacifica]ODA29213.1 hypothetical protein A8L45_22540 [Veronia pacifica]
MTSQQDTEAHVQPNTTVVFDFDGTLVSHDTGYQFFKWRIQRSPFRSLCFALFLPIILLLFLWQKTRTTGLNLILLIAMAGQKTPLIRLHKQFISKYFSDIGARIFHDGVDELKQHQASGKNVVILSGCPDWLLRGVVRHMGIRHATVIGSPCRVSCFGLVMKEHCFRENKLKIAKEHGLLECPWEAGYSDSRNDIPMLQTCTRRILINVKKNKVNAFRRALSEGIEFRQW